MGFKFSEIILFQNDHYILINKPPFISTLADRNDKLNLLALARKYCPEAQAAHRIDKDTSGILAFAKTPESYRHLSMQFESRGVKKVYHAVVDGVHQLSSTTVKVPILKNNDGTVRISSKGKSAETEFNTLEVFRMHTLLECFPVTGRMHQIRIHLSHIGSPVTGDVTYGGKPFFISSVKKAINLKRWTEEAPLLSRFALHASSLSFLDLSGEPIHCLAPYPKDFKALLNQLRKNMR